MIKKRLIGRKKNEEASRRRALQIGRTFPIKILPLSRIRVPAKARPNLENIEELAASIGTNGILQPLVVVKVAGGFKLVAGHRRLAALKMIGTAEAPARIIIGNAVQIAALRLLL